MNNKITDGFDNLVSRIQQYRNEVEQIEKDNNKLNEDLQALEKERDEGYKSFNTDTHILIERHVLKSIKEDLDEAKSSACYAVDEAGSAQSCAEEARGSAESAEDYCRYAMDKIDETIEQADKNKGYNNE